MRRRDIRYRKVAVTGGPNSWDRPHELVPVYGSLDVLPGVVLVDRLIDAVDDDHALRVLVDLAGVRPGHVLAGEAADRKATRKLGDTKRLTKSMPCCI